jgi:hypothetical protein
LYFGQALCTAHHLGVHPLMMSCSICTRIRPPGERVASTHLAEVSGKALAQTLALTGDESRWSAVRLAFWTTRLQLIRTIVERAVERNEVPANTDPLLMLETLVAPLSFRTIVIREPIDDQLCTRLTDLVLDGILPRATNEKGSYRK